MKRTENFFEQYMAEKFEFRLGFELLVPEPTGGFSVLFKKQNFTVK